MEALKLPLTSSHRAHCVTGEGCTCGAKGVHADSGEATPLAVRRQGSPLTLLRSRALPQLCTTRSMALDVSDWMATPALVF